jgi:hypothetical protein
MERIEPRWALVSRIKGIAAHTKVRTALMLTQELVNELRDRASEAAPIEFREVAYLDGAVPQFNKCHDNVKRWIAENPRCMRVRGWLVSSGAIFDKHSVVREEGRLYDITPLRTLGTPFLRYLGSDEGFCQIPNQINVTVIPADWLGSAPDEPPFDENPD